jgi:multicomponent Na+:H+ antiporter subunit G
MSTGGATTIALTIVFAGIGGLFFFVGTLGVLRLPDFYCRTHAATKCDTVGAGSLLIGLAIYSGWEPSTVKILLVAVLVLFTSPTAGHALARAAHLTGLRPWSTRKERETA